MNDKDYSSNDERSFQERMDYYENHESKESLRADRQEPSLKIKDQEEVKVKMEVDEICRILANTISIEYNGKIDIGSDLVVLAQAILTERMGNESIDKKVYYCDYCRKHSLTLKPLSVHELHCTANPDRLCRVECADGRILRVLFLNTK